MPCHAVPCYAADRRCNSRHTRPIMWRLPIQFSTQRAHQSMSLQVSRVQSPESRIHSPAWVKERKSELCPYTVTTSLPSRLHIPELKSLCQRPCSPHPVYSQSRVQSWGPSTRASGRARYHHGEEACRRIGAVDSGGFIRAWRPICLFVWRSNGDPSPQVLIKHHGRRARAIQRPAAQRGFSNSMLL